MRAIVALARVFCEETASSYAGATFYADIDWESKLHESMGGWLGKGEWHGAECACLRVWARGGGVMQDIFQLF